MVFLDFFIRQIHEVDEDNIDVFKIAFQIRNICLHQFRLTRSTNTRDNLDVRSAIQFNDSIEIFCSCDCFHLVTHFQKLKFFLFFETASLYLVYCLLIVYARCRFQKHKIFYFLKVETMDSKFHKKKQFPANIWLKKHILPSRGMFFL